MSESFDEEISNTAVSQCAVTNAHRAVLTKQVNAGQEIVVATEPSHRDGGSLDAITVQSHDSETQLFVQFFESVALCGRILRWQIENLTEPWNKLPPDLEAAIVRLNTKYGWTDSSPSGLSLIHGQLHTASIESVDHHQSRATPPKAANSMPLESVRQSSKNDPSL